MAKMFALKLIHKNDVKSGEPIVVQKRTVFDATPDEAKQLDALKAARPATADEIASAKELAEKAEGTFFTGSETAPAQDATKPASGAHGDPQAAPKK